MKTLFITAALTAFTFAGFAQTPGTTNQESTNQRNTVSPQTGQQDYLRTHSDRMSKDFKLTDEQSKRLNELNTTHYTQQSNMRMSNTDRSTWKQSDEAANKEYDRQLRGVLNDSQYKQYESNRQNYSFDYDQNNVNTVAPTNRQGTNQPNQR
jgi:hypothetical protein